MRFRFTKRFLSFVLVIMLIFTMIPIDKVYASDVGVCTDGDAVDLSLWNYSANGDTYCLNAYKGSIVDGKIVGSVPATINGKRVTEMLNTFRECTDLIQAPEIPDSVTDMTLAFSGCTGLAKASEIPVGVTNIGSAFWGCTGLTKVPKIPNSVTDISFAFAYCTGLTQAPEIPNGVTNMSGTFTCCSGLTQAPIIPNSVTNMSVTFTGCTRLTQAPEIPNSVMDMNHAFENCTGLTQAPNIPNSVTNMSYTFSGCTGLTQAPELPNSVTDMSYTFARCTDLMQAPKIPNGVTNMKGTFYGCKGLMQAPIIIPNSVIYMTSTFSGCTGLTQVPEIPDNVINMQRAFANCKGLTQAPKIPNGVENMSFAFFSCTNLTGNVFIPKKATDLTDVLKDTSKPINMIYSPNNLAAASYEAPSNVTKVVDSVSPEISSVTGGDTSNIAINATDNYQIDSYAVTTSDAVPTTGWQSSNVFPITSDGTYYAWAIDGVGNVSAGKAFVYPLALGTDVNAVDLDLWDFTVNGDNYSLNGYKGSIVDGKIVGSVPAMINGKAVTAMSNTFKGCTGLTKAPELPKSVTNMFGIFEGCTGLIQVPEIPSTVTNMEYAFSGCKGLKQAPQIPVGVTNMRYTFNGCTGLSQPPVLPSAVTTINHTFSGCTALTQTPEIPDGVTDMNAAFSKCAKLTQTPEIPNSVIDMSYAFYMCTGLTQMTVIPNSVADMKYTFSGCTKLTGDIFIPKSVIRMSNVFTNTSKPINMIYSSNNTLAASAVVPSNVTKVVDSALPEISSFTEVDGNITINATDNYSVEKYAITTSSAVPTTGWQTSNVFANITDGIYYAWAMDRVGNVSISKAFVYPQAVAIGTDGNEVDMLLWDFTANSDTYSLDGYAGSIVDGKIVGSVPAIINGKPVTAMLNTFKGCTDLIQAPELPNSLTNMFRTFDGCTGLTQVPEIPSTVTNMEYAFSGCKSLTQAPQLPVGVTNMRYTFNNCTAIIQAPVLPSTVTTINHTFSSCTALAQTPKIPAGVTDMNAAFSKCTKLTQTPQIPDSVIDMSYAFYMCTGLTQMPVIPNSVTDMKYTFSGCTNLTGEIFIPNSVIRMLNIFTNTSMPITMKYSSDNTIASSYIAPSNVTKVIGTLDLPDVEVPVLDDIEGSIDIVNANSIIGWAWQPSKNNDPIDVQIYIDGKFIAAIKADIFRQDLENKGNGKHGFNYVVNWSGYSEGSHLIEAYAVVGPNYNSKIGSQYYTINPTDKINFSINKDTFYDTDEWQYTISTTPAMKNQPITCSIWKNGVFYGDSATGTTDADGKLVTTGKFSPELVGDWMQRVKIGNTVSNTIAFKVLLSKIDFSINKDTFYDADEWQYTISTTPAMRNQPITCSMWKNGVFYGDSATGTTDADGKFVTTGKFSLELIGDWTQRVKIGNTLSNTIAFKVLPSKINFSINKDTFYDTDEWQYTISTMPEMRNQPITCSMWKNGVFYGDSAAGTTDADGNFVTTGKFSPELVGDWTQRVKIGNTVSNTIAFKVLPTPQN